MTLARTYGWDAKSVDMAIFARTNVNPTMSTRKLGIKKKKDYWMMLVAEAESYNRHVDMTADLDIVEEKAQICRWRDEWDDLYMETPIELEPAIAALQDMIKILSESSGQLTSRHVHAVLVAAGTLKNCLQRPS